MPLFIVQTLLLLMVIFFVGYLLGRVVKNVFCKNTLAYIETDSVRQKVDTNYARTADRLADKYID